MYLLSFAPNELRTGIERLVCMTGIYTQKDPANPRWVELLRPLARSFVYDMALMENTIMNSHVRYTIVRPPILTKGMTLTLISISL